MYTLLLSYLNLFASSLDIKIKKNPLKLKSFNIQFWTRIKYREKIAKIIKYFFHLERKSLLIYVQFQLIILLIQRITMGFEILKMITGIWGII